MPLKKEVKICRWEESGLSIHEIESLIAAIGNELPDTLSERTDIKKYVKKLITYGSLYMVIDTNKKPYGVMAFYSNDHKTKTAYLSIIGLLPSVHRMGIGKRLMKILFLESKKAQMNEIALEVNKENISATSFYKKMGFRITSVGPAKFIMTTVL